MKNFEALETLETAAAEQWGIYLLPSAQHGSSLDIRVAWVVLGGDMFPATSVHRFSQSDGLGA